MSTAKRLSPEIAHHLDARHLLALVPDLDQRHLSDLRQDFARYLAYPDHRSAAPTSWQHAWNAWTGASAPRNGLISIRIPRCPDCRHGVSHRNISRNISRTGNPHICGTCRGTGRGSVLRLSAHYAPEPEAASPDAAPDDATAGQSGP